MARSIREEVTAIYQASGYVVAQSQLAHVLIGTRERDGRKEVVAVSMPFEVPQRPDVMQLVSEIVSWAPAPGRIFVVALPKNLSLQAEFQKRVADAGGKLRSYAGILDGGYGGTDYIGLGSEDRREADKLRERLFNYSRVDADLLSAVLRKQYTKKALAESPTRVQQLYFIRDGIDISDRRPTEGTDLLHHLVARLGQPATGPEVFLIVGPGGAGKSWLFEGLFTYLYEAFQRRKEQQEPGVRPIPVMPDSLIAAGARSARDLFDAVAATEYGGSGGMELLDHQIRSGHNILMFDGLDEFFADNQDVGQTIADRYFTPDSRARIFVVLRDSLLETSQNVRDMARRFAEQLGPDGFSIYELALWDTQFAQRELAWLKFEKRRPRPGEHDTPAVAGFLAWLAQSKRMQELARLAFYCDLLADLYVQEQERAAMQADPDPKKSDQAILITEHRSGRQMPEDEFDVLELCFDLIIDRELAKQRPDPEQVPELAFVRSRLVGGPPEKRSLRESLSQLFELGFVKWLKLQESDRHPVVISPFSTESTDGNPHLAEGRLGLVQLVQEAAYFSRRRPEGALLTSNNLRDLYGKLQLGAGDDDRLLGERMLRQFVLFVQGQRPGTVDFAHEFMADFLAARHVVAERKAGRGKLSDLVGRPNQGETEVFRGYIERELGAH